MWLLLLKNHWKKFLVLALMLACFAGGAYVDHKLMKPEVVVQVKEKIVEKEKIVTVEVEKKNTKTKKKTVKVTKPDGTTTETTTEDTEIKEETATNTTKESEKTTKKETKATAQSQYRLGAFASRPIPELFKDPLTKPDLGVMAGYRIWGPAWAETSYTFDTKELSLGLSVEF